MTLKMLKIVHLSSSGMKIKNLYIGSIVGNETIFYRNFRIASIAILRFSIFGINLLALCSINIYNILLRNT